MTYKVKFDRKAKLDLIEIFKFIAYNDSIEKAEKLTDNLELVCLNLSKFPERGHIPNELRLLGIKRYLEIDYKPYRVIYEIKKKYIYVHAVLDGRRNVKEILEDRILR